MDARWTDIIDRLQNMFPESDGSVLSALVERRDLAARYIAQIHDLTLAEALEGVEWVLSAPGRKPAQAIAAE